DYAVGTRKTAKSYSASQRACSCWLAGWVKHSLDCQSLPQLFSTLPHTSSAGGTFRNMPGTPSRKDILTPTCSWSWQQSARRFWVNLPKVHCFSSSLVLVMRWRNAPSTAPVALSARWLTLRRKLPLSNAIAKNWSYPLNHFNSKMSSSSALVCASLWTELSSMEILVLTNPPLQASRFP